MKSISNCINRAFCHGNLKFWFRTGCRLNRVFSVPSKLPFRKINRNFYPLHCSIKCFNRLQYAIYFSCILFFFLSLMKKACYPFNQSELINYLTPCINTIHIYWTGASFTAVLVIRQKWIGSWITVEFVCVWVCNGMSVYETYFVMIYANIPAILDFQSDCIKLNMVDWTESSGKKGERQIKREREKIMKRWATARFHSMFLENRLLLPLLLQMHTHLHSKSFIEDLSCVPFHYANWRWTDLCVRVSAVCVCN